MSLKEYEFFHYQNNHSYKRDIYYCLSDFFSDPPQSANKFLFVGNCEHQPCSYHFAMLRVHAFEKSNLPNGYTSQYDNNVKVTRTWMLWRCALGFIERGCREIWLFGSGPMRRWSKIVYYLVIAWRVNISHWYEGWVLHDCYANAIELDRLDKTWLDSTHGNPDRNPKQLRRSFVHKSVKFVQFQRVHIYMYKQLNVCCVEVFETALSARRNVNARRLAVICAINIIWLERIHSEWYGANWRSDDDGALALTHTHARSCTAC